MKPFFNSSAQYTFPSIVNTHDLTIPFAMCLIDDLIISVFIRVSFDIHCPLLSNCKQQRHYDGMISSVADSYLSLRLRVVSCPSLFILLDCGLSLDFAASMTDYMDFKKATKSYSRTTEQSLQKYSHKKQNVHSSPILSLIQIFC